MFRIMIRSAGAVAAAAVIASLSACGPVQMGAAAIVGGQRIPTSTLSADVSALNKAYQANPALQQAVQYTPAQMPRLVLTRLVAFRIVDDIARRNGIQVTPAEAQAALDTALVQLGQQTGGGRATVAELAMAGGFPPNMAGQFGRFQATIAKLQTAFSGAKSAAAPTAAQQQLYAARINAEVNTSLKRLKIKINPRFGQFDPRQLTVVTAPDLLSRPEAAAQ